MVRPVNRFRSSGLALAGLSASLVLAACGPSGAPTEKSAPETQAQTLDLAVSNGAPYVQLCTWNDYGEGTMIEPTREFGYGFLATLQQRLGVTYGQNEFNLIDTLYDDRKQYAGDAAKQAQLDQAFADLASLQVSAAASLL